MELVCMDFWTAEQTEKKFVDVLVVTDHFCKLAHAFPCKNQLAKQVPVAFGITFSAYMYMVSLNAFIQIREIILRVDSLKSSWKWPVSRNLTPPHTILWEIGLWYATTELLGT